MKDFSYKTGAFLLSLMVLFSSLGFTVSSHFCGGKKVKIAIGFMKKDLTCGMKMKTTDCTEKEYLQSICCKNIFDYYHIEDNVKKELTEIFEPVFTIIDYPADLKYLYRAVEEYTQFTVFPPPEIVRNMPLVHQTFLI